MASLNRIIPNLWFDDNAEEAARFYISVFDNSKIGRIARFGKEGFEHHGKPEGSVMTVEFEIAGQTFVGLNGGPHFKFSEAISFIVNCETQGEVDYYWEKLSEGGNPEAQQCGWLKDKYGVSWQIIPAIVNEIVSDPDDVKSQRAMKALLSMKKLNIDALKKAYTGNS